MNEGDGSGYRGRATGDRGNIGHGTELGSRTVNRSAGNTESSTVLKCCASMLFVAVAVAVALIIAGPRWVRTFTAGT